MHAPTAIATRPLMKSFGAEILDVNLAQADESALAHVVNTFHRHGAILLRGQTLEAADLVRFASAFGEPEDHTMKDAVLPDYPKVFVLSNRAVQGKALGSHRDGVGWHTDYSYKEKPVMCTMLYAVEVPPEGGDTLLADMCAAYAELPDDERDSLSTLQLHHSYQHFMSTRQYGRRELTEQQKAENPDVVHPLIRTHPADGRKALWPSTGTVTHIAGMPPDESLALLEKLIEYATQPRFVYRHRWQPGDVLVWDNRCTLHTGTLFDDQRYVRELYRLWVRGDRPF